VSPYLWTVRTFSGATAAQIVHSCHPEPRDIEHIGSAHSVAEVVLLTAPARRVRDLVAYLEPTRGHYYCRSTTPTPTARGSFDLESSLRRFGDADWIGSEELARFDPLGTRPRPLLITRR
jgi:hypothetical protein